jgi:hypothetical protein
MLATDPHGQRQDDKSFCPAPTKMGQAKPAVAYRRMGLRCPKGLTIVGRQVVFLLSSSCRWQKKKEFEGSIEAIERKSQSLTEATEIPRDL